MRCTAFAFLAAAATAALFGSSARGQNLFVNPGFETGDSSGWNSLSVLPNSTTGEARTGQYFARSFSLTQTVPVEPDTLYELGSWVSFGLGNSGAALGVQLGDETGNVTPQGVTLESTPTDPGYVNMRRLYRTAPGQTTATITMALTPPVFEMNWDDAHMTPWTAPIVTRPGERVARTGEVLPDGSGPVVALESPMLVGGTTLSAAQVGSGSSPHFGLLVSEAGIQTEPVQTGTPVVDGGTVFPISHPTGNRDGDIAFAGGKRVGTRSVSGIFRQEADGDITTVASSDTTSPDGNGTPTFFDSPVMSNAGVAFRSQLFSTAHPGSDDYGIYYRPEGGALRVVARSGSAAPGGGTFSTPLPSRLSLNDAGQIAFVANIEGVAGSTAGLFLDDGSGPQRLTSYKSLDISVAPALNEPGDIAIATGNSALAFTEVHLIPAGGSDRTLVSAGQAAPGGSTFSLFGQPGINDSAQTAFAASLADGTSGIFRADPNGSVTPIVLSSQLRPGGAVLGGWKPFVHPYSRSAAPEEPAILSGGQVAIVNFSESARSEAGIYLADPSEIVPVAAWGDAVDGGVITGFTWDPNRRLQVNDFGQIAYQALLADGTARNILYTPTLHWRSHASGDWSDSNNWTVGLTPAAVHPVRIDSPNGVTVTGPAGQTTIKSLSITSGNTLDLTAGSSIATTDGTTLDAGAFLRGSGTISGNVTNAGTISPGDSAGKITIAGDYQQTGRLELQLMDSGFDQLDITGDALLDGEIDVTGSALPGKTFDLITVAGALSGTPTWNLPGDGSSWKILDKPGIGQVFEVTYVPEPSCAAAAAIAAIGLLNARRRRKIGSI